jgi:hypothetical protein
LPAIDCESFGHPEEQRLYSQFATHGQLWEFMRDGCYELNRRCFCWRIKRLAGHGFVTRHYLPMVDREFIYAIGVHGLTYLEGQGDCYSGPAGGPGTKITEMNVAHAVGLNSIHLRLLRAGVLVAWQPGVEIRSQNELTTSRYAKDYDAVVTIRLDGTPKRFALEYERTAKGHREYEKIKALIESEHRIERFLYLVSNEHLQSFLKQCFWSTKRPVYIGLMAGLLKGEPASLEVVDAATWRPCYLDEIVLPPHALTRLLSSLTAHLRGVGNRVTSRELVLTTPWSAAFRKGVGNACRELGIGGGGTAVVPGGANGAAKSTDTAPGDRGFHHPASVAPKTRV